MQLDEVARVTEYLQAKWDVRYEPLSPEAWLEQRLSHWPKGDALAAKLNSCLPKFLKAQLPFELPEDWIPPAFREHPEHVLSFEMALEVRRPPLLTCELS